jgi:hypothetical protein
VNARHCGGLLGDCGNDHLPCGHHYAAATACAACMVRKGSSVRVRLRAFILGLWP